MPEMSAYPAGSFCWVDLATTDPGAAKKFYTEVFGWEAKDVPAGKDGVYTMFTKGGKNVCALYQLDDNLKKMGVPPHWMSYVSVDDVDASAAKVAGLGGQVLAGPFDVMEAGRMAAVKDSGGAPFALWQPNLHAGAELVNEPDTWCWNELYANDIDAAKEFYAGLFGWTSKISKSPTGADYIELHNGDRPAGGMMAIQKEWGEVPPNWAIYLCVASLSATLEKAKSMGAKAEMDPLKIPGVGTLSVISDPQGAYFSVIEMEPGAAQT